MPNDMTPTTTTPSSPSSTTSDPGLASPTSPASDSSASPAYDRISNETSPDADLPFSGLGNDYDDALSDFDLPTSPTKPVVAATPPSPPVAPQPAAATAPASQPPAAPAAPDAAAAQAPDASASAAPASQTDVPPADLDALLTAMEERAAEISQQVLPQFQLTPEQIAELETDAAGAVPKLLANAYLKSIKTTMSMMKQVVPQLIQTTLQQQEAGRELETAFFKQWNLLDRAKHGDDIRMFAKTFATAKPGMTQAELFSLVGAAVMAKHGLSATAAVAAPSSPAASFTPAVASAPVLHQKPVDDQNPFAGMGRHFDDD